MQDKDPRTLTIHRGTPEFMVLVEAIAKAMRLTGQINRLTVDDVEAVNALFAELTGRPVPFGFRLFPPWLTQRGWEVTISPTSPRFTLHACSPSWSA